MNPAIEFKNVHRRFKDQPVLKGLSFQVQEGQIYGLLGRNGTGKTTALRILLGMLQPHGGETFVQDKESRSFGTEDRKCIGYVSEGHVFYREFRVAKALDFEAGTRPGFDKAFALRAIHDCGFGTRKPIHQLSRGQRAQLSLIMAIAGNPKILIMDDPALGLDTVMRREFLDAMIDFLANRGTTVLFSSHILSDVQRIADRVGILQSGRLVIDATMDDLQTRLQIRTWKGSALHGISCLIGKRKMGESHELLLLDATPEALQQLASKGAILSEPSTPTLEEVFIHMTTQEGKPIFRAPVEEAVV
ncbi:MAG: ABC-2 type transport system ATP-binding protein [Planctomycetota bacterium]|jgi:ABC-2 type transport system ATP-binding protein